MQLFKRCCNLSASTVLQGCSCLSGVATYLPALSCRGAAVLVVLKPICWHCVAGMQLFKQCRKPICWALCCRGAGCPSGVSFYLLSRLDGQNWIYCSTFILGFIRLSLGTCNCFCLGVPFFLLREIYSVRMSTSEFGSIILLNKESLHLISVDPI